MVGPSNPRSVYPRSPGMVLVRSLLPLIVLFALLSPVRAQQPNTWEATLSVNGAFAGPTFPVPVGGLPGGVAHVLIRGAPAAANLPFALAYGPITVGTVVNSLGSVDLNVFQPSYGLAYNGFWGGFPSYPWSFLGPHAAFTFASYYQVGYAVPAGAQALVADPTHPWGARLSAAVDFAPTVADALNVHLAGGGTPLWQNNNGVINLPANCPSSTYLNQEITFHFGGIVYQSSIPAPGPAVGSINILSSSGVPATGHFVIRDDPRLPAGNRRMVSFFPDLPLEPSCSNGGLLPNETYTIELPNSGPEVVVVDGTPIATHVLACFETPTCDPGSPLQSFTDHQEGAPVLLGSAPLLANPAPAPISPASIANNTITLTISQYLMPGTVDATTIYLIDETDGSQLPAQVTLIQTGAYNTEPIINLTLTDPLDTGRTYRLEAAPVITDLEGLPLELVPGNAGAPLYLQT